MLNKGPKDKFGAKTVNVRMVGYEGKSMYRVYLPESRKIYLCSSVRFNEQPTCESLGDGNKPSNDISECVDDHRNSNTTNGSGSSLRCSFLDNVFQGDVNESSDDDIDEDQTIQEEDDVQSISCQTKNKVGRPKAAEKKNDDARDGGGRTTTTTTATTTTKN
ncbi:hypothetical protein SSS_06746 [Sarcoptes scabiei]|uniref:Retroviral polymerase SH3-like domain-containing protein n=1 Tax=Sarcoptes scabiei TaxID=52283 RepID=A0A834VH35_SARSC|nr:hypothetical protein SSS_06746 [Sarcoptes scabiei]